MNKFNTKNEENALKLNIKFSTLLMNEKALKMQFAAKLHSDVPNEQDHFTLKGLESGSACAPCIKLQVNQFADAANATTT